MSVTIPKRGKDRTNPNFVIPKSRCKPWIGAMRGINRFKWRARVFYKAGEAIINNLRIGSAVVLLLTKKRARLLKETFKPPLQGKVASFLFRQCQRCPDFDAWT